MQEINLLQNKVKDRTLQFERSNRLVMVFFSLLLLLEIGAVAGLFFLIKSTDAKTQDVIKANLQTQAEMNTNQKDLVKAQGFQAQLKNVRSLIDNHIYWSAFLDQLAKITPTKVQFRTVTGSVADNKLHVEGVAQSYQDVGRVLLSLETSDKFKQVKLRSVNPSQDSAFGYSFALEITVSPDIFIKTQ
ncbi:MAG: PilN domain-containing protein [Candidatus Doudnabacteria bacterium]|nr:PilN domain-containing protein [Candidatus Doudnabacteria bacterium]